MMPLTKYERAALKMATRDRKEEVAHRLGCSAEALSRLEKGGHDARLEHKLRGAFWKEVLQAVTPKPHE